MVSELDVIELRVAIDAWEAGMIATVLEAGADTVLAEVADADGRTLETLVVPIEAVRRVERGDVSKRPKPSQAVPTSDRRKSAA
jgi:hypothetical protein